MARHYRTTLVPARACKPKDKAADENMVGHVSRRIIAALRNRQFFSLHEINQSIREELIKLINRPFQKLEGNRLSAFERIDKPLLQKLPATRYEYADWKEVKVQFNYHVEYEGSFYSVPYCYVGQLCSLRATTKTIEIYLDSERIAAHPRNYNSFKRYTTLPAHMPEEHKIVYGWSAKAFLSWAEKIGPNTMALIHSILESREYPVQAYRSCMGVMRLGKTYPAEVMEKASLEALDKNTCSYKYFSILVKQIATAGVQKGPERIVQHDNLISRAFYNYEGLRT